MKHSTLLNIAEPPVSSSKCVRHEKCIFAETHHCINRQGETCVFTDEEGRKKLVLAYKENGNYQPMVSWPADSRIIDDVRKRCRIKYDCELFTWSETAESYVVMP